MIDLNVEIVSDMSTCEEENRTTTMIMKLKTPPPLKASSVQMDDSGTSNSSVVSADEEPPTNAAIAAGDAYSSGSTRTITTTTSTFNFDILNKPLLNFTTTHLVGGDHPALEFATKQLFPVTADSGSSSTSSPQAQWLNLSFSDSTEQSEVKILQQKQQQQQQPQQPQHTPVPVKKSRRGPRSRSSQYRGVTFYRRTGRWESHIWDCGKQVYLGGFDTAHAAARAYDRAALKFRGVEADINFTLVDYEDELKQMKDLNKEEFVHILRRQSTGFSRGSSKYRGVTLHKCGRWEARMGQFLGKKYMYLGLFDSEVEAARAYDMAALKSNGREAVTNFEASTYGGEMTLDANNRSGGHNLELSLGISPPSDGPKGNVNVEEFHLRCAAMEIPNRESLMVESSAFAPVSGQLPHGVAMASRHPPIWSAMHPGSLPKYEDQAIQKRVDDISSTRFSNWAWQMHGHGSVAPMPYFSNAASSGFSPSFPTASSGTLPQFQQKNTGHNLFLQAPTTSSTTASHYYGYKS